VKKHIPLYDCVDRGHYIIAARNFQHGVFSARLQGFIGIRTKFEARYLDIEYHYDTGAPHGTASPFKLIGEAPSDTDVTILGEDLFKWLEEHKPKENWRDV